MAATLTKDVLALEELINNASPTVLNQPNGNGDTVLHWAAFKGLEQACSLLLQRGVSLEARGDVGNTPLHVAAAGAHERVVALLLYHGALVVSSGIEGCMRRVMFIWACLGAQCVTL